MKKPVSYIIATLGSHSALQILKGAKDEGFKTLVIVTRDREGFYRRFGFIDRFVTVESFRQLDSLWSTLPPRIILIPHGSFVAYLGVKGNKAISISYFGNKKVLDWEANRLSQLRWLRAAHILVPRVFAPKDTIDRAVIVKSYGAAGGTGYFVVHSQSEFNRKIKQFMHKDYFVQEYIIGVPMYFHYFYSPLTKQVELMSIDRRYETNVDSLGRLPLVHQESINITPSFVVVGNSPLSVRESLLPEVYDMAERLVHTSKKLINARGLFGPFCLETVITPDQKIYVMEVSCRIVAGTNLFVEGSPYGAFHHDTPMSTGRRIACEIRTAITNNTLDVLLD